MNGCSISLAADPDTPELQQPVAYEIRPIVQFLVRDMIRLVLGVPACLALAGCNLPYNLSLHHMNRLSPHELSLVDVLLHEQLNYASDLERNELLTRLHFTA